MGIPLSSMNYLSDSTSTSSSKSSSASSEFSSISKLPLLQDLIEKLDDVKEKLNDNEYKEIVDTIAILSNDQYKLVDIKKDIIITNNELSLHDNRVQTIIDFISKSGNWNFLSLLRIDFSKREYSNVIYQVLEKIGDHHMYQFSRQCTDKECTRIYKNAITFENVKFTQTNVNADSIPYASQETTYDLLQLLHREIDSYGKILTTQKIAPLIFDQKAGSTLKNIDKNWYRVAKLLLLMEPSFNYLPLTMRKEYEIVSSINFVDDFYNVNESFKKDQSLILKLFKKNVFFYKYLSDANKSKYKYEVLNPQFDLRCSEVIFMQESKIKDCIIDQLPDECFRDILYIYRFISKFKTTFILRKCHIDLKTDENFILSVYQLDFHKSNFLFDIDESLLEEDFIERLVQYDTQRSLDMIPLRKKKNDEFTANFLSYIRTMYSYEFRNSIAISEDSATITRSRRKRSRTGN